MFAQLLGGIGLFLLGMILLTDGLKSLAGGALRDVLMRFTGGRLQAAASGAAVTAIVQSSSATTLATIGFVSAGLLPFSQAVGVIIGGAVGTTSTGWLVSLLGLKYSISVVALPMVGVGALMRLLGRGRAAHIGLAVAGFGVIFVGISTLQSGMETLAGRFDLTAISGDTLGGRALLVAIGFAMTVIMQSSSAAVATTMTALHSGAIGFEQACVLVIGQNIGTSATAAIAAIGASTPAKRTALAHVCFNLSAGALAFIALPIALHIANTLDSDQSEGAISLAAFHTSFNIAAAALFLPWLDHYSRLISRIVRDRGPQLTRNLDNSLLNVPTIAVEAARRTVMDTAGVIFGAARDALVHESKRGHVDAALNAAANALGETQRFLGSLRAEPASGDERARRVNLLHAIDHLERLTQTLRKTEPARIAQRDPDVHAARDLLLEALEPVRDWIRGERDDAPEQETADAVRDIAEMRRSLRPALLERTATGDLDPERTLNTLDATRWLDRIGYHAWRAVHHLAERPPPDAAPQGEEPDVLTPDDADDAYAGS
ncbi:MAG: Na/Pi cotransporter family protein [Phycisphaerales bacterium]|nr:MAG: Na/Pi cotransporter family protein [Phycisphaerales bacterium]